MSRKIFFGRILSVIVLAVVAGLSTAQTGAPQVQLLAPPEPNGPCLFIETEIAGKIYCASATCVQCDGKKSLVLTNNHVFAVQAGPDAPFPVGSYPIPAKLFSLDLKTTWAAKGVAGDADADLAAVVVDGTMLAASLAKQNAAVGAEVWHKGYNSKFTIGTVLAYTDKPNAASKFASTLRSMPGDSGAGVFDSKTGEIVAVNCGRHDRPDDAPQRGVTVLDVRAFLKRYEKATGFKQ